MPNDLGLICSHCDGHHTQLPMAFHAPAPDFWDATLADDPHSTLSPDRCVIKNQAFFVQGLIEIPVTGTEEIFRWGVWVSLSRENFVRATELWDSAGREAEPPYFGWLSTELSLYSQSTVDLKTNAHTRPVGTRPSIELEPTDHPLAVEQRTGITLERVREIAAALRHEPARAR